jgi:hypothetical protein
MAGKTVVAGSSVTASQLKDFFRQIEDGSIDHSRLQGFLDHRDFVSRYPHFNPVTFIGKGWGVDEDREGLPETWDPMQTILVSPLRKGESCVKGEKTIERLAGDKPLGARAFLYFWTYQEKIPKEWKGKLVFFDATMLRDPDGYRYSLYLYWSGVRWYWRCHWLGDARVASYLSACAS